MRGEKKNQKNFFLRELFYSYSVWALVAYLICFAPGLGPVPWAISSEIFSVKGV